MSLGPAQRKNRSIWGMGGDRGPREKNRSIWGTAGKMDRRRVAPGPSPHLPAGLGGHFKGGLESSSLLRGEDGPGSLGPSGVLPIVPAALALASLALGGFHVPIFILALYCGDKPGLSGFKGRFPNSPGN